MLPARLGVVLFCFALILRADADTGRAVLEKGYYSFQAPPGWTVPPSKQVLMQSCTGPVAKRFTPRMDVSIINGPANASGVIQHLVDGWKGRFSEGAHVLSLETVFVTAAGLDGYRAAISCVLAHSDTRLTVVLYAFQFDDHQKVYIEAACASDYAAKNVPLFDASVKTLSLE